MIIQQTLQYPFVGINGIYTWLKLLASNFSWCFYVHKNKIKELFLNTTKTTPTPEYIKKKSDYILTDIGGEWYVNKYCHQQAPVKICV